MPRLFLIDGMSIAYRAYFAFISRPLINSKGMNTSAIFGFVNALEKILTDEKPDHIAVAWDSKEPTFRHEQYPEYKANRQAMPDDMVAQLDPLKDVIRAYNIPMIELPGWEADDIIGTLAKRAEAEGFECFLVTPDKDYLQLVSETVKVYKPPRGNDAVEIIDVAGVKDKFGVAPHQVIDVLGLMGDQSDNVPGVKGIGEKTAIPLVQEYGSIQGIYENIASIKKEGTRKKLEEQKDTAFLSRRLVTIATDAPVAIDVHALHAAKKDFAKLKEFFTEFEFRQFLTRLQKEESTKAETPEQAEFISSSALQNSTTIPHSYLTITTEPELQRMVAEISRHAEFCFDVETTSTNAHIAELVGISFAVKPHHAYYIPTNHLLDVKNILQHIEPLLTDTTKTIIGQNIKYDLLVLDKYGISSDAPLFDSMLASYALSAEGEHSMDALARQYLQYDPVSITSLIGSGKQQGSMNDVPLEQIAEYAAEDADITLQLAHILRSKLREKNQERLCAEIEFPLLNVLIAMEAKGVKIDMGMLGGISKELERHIDNAQNEIIRHAGVKFNIASTQQLGDVLFNKLGLPAQKKTKTGYSTDISVLESLQGMHPIIESILLYRQMSKLKSTYVDALPKLINTRTGRVHTSFNQAVAATGRLSSADPNLQNIPMYMTA